MKIAVFDIDGVLCNFEGLLVDICGEGSGRQFYSLEDRYKGDVLRKAHEIFKDPNYYYGLDPIPEGFVLLAETISRKYDVLFLTSRPDVGSMENFTKRWLNREISKIGYEFKDLLGVKFSSDKTDFLKKIKKDVAFLVDDNPYEVENAKRHGVPAFAFAQLWNEHVYPKIFVTRDGYTMVQGSEWQDAEFFWQNMEAE